MSVKISVIGPRSISGIRRLNDAIKVKAAQKASKLHTRQLGDTTRKHYRNAVQQVRNIMLNPGIGPVSAGGSKTARFRQVDGSKGWVRTAPWAPLSISYAAQRPESTTFWRKTGRTSLYFGIAVYTHPPTARAKRVRFSIREKGFTLESEVYLSRLPAPLDKMVTEAFVSPGKDLGMLLPEQTTINRRSLHRIIFPEKQRPMVSRVTSALGRKWLEALKSK